MTGERTDVIGKPVRLEGLDILVGKEYIVVWMSPRLAECGTGAKGVSDLQERYGFESEESLLVSLVVLLVTRATF